ncbi:MAG: hypothetical protein AAFQ86_17640 [Bacteroidota bacterium]
MTNYLNHLGATATFNSRTWGMLRVESASFTEAVDGDLVVFVGDPEASERPIVRIHSECVFAEAFDSDLCDCADQLRLAMERLRLSGGGILFYLRLDGRGAGLCAKVAATKLEVEGLNTYESRVKIGVPPEGRSFKGVGLYLLEKGIDSITMLTNSNSKMDDLVALGIDIRREPLLAKDINDNIRSLYRAKRDKFGHYIPSDI